MGLVDYSDSDSDSEPTPKPPQPAAAASTSTTSKKPFQKLIDRSGTGAGKIVVSLPSASSTSADEPPAKRAKTIGASTGASRFSSFGSFLPPPKKTNASVAKPTPSSRGSAPAPGVHLRTAAEPAFRRSSGLDDDDDDGNNHDPGSTGGGSSLGNALPPPRRTPAGPSIPEGMKPESEVKLVGKPLMFKPLSVMRKPGAAGTKKKALPPGFSRSSKPASSTTTAPPPANPPPPKKISLFSADDDDDPPSHTTTTTDPEPSSGAYEPLFTTAPTTHDTTQDTPSHHPPPQHQPPAPANAITDGLQLSAKARRELFGRTGNPDVLPANARVVNFNMEQEYEHNEALRQAGDQAAFNPVRSIAPGKHSLRQMVNMVQSNQSALEDSFAQAGASKRDAAGRYGWK
ncbi:mitotic checkpoint regulator, MAD2B-interacting-domain-containing protein [Podospora conica]|nr:mitotic checkpoint regulator, MAD2B-interacting-domain-containing protein [Schizothecium conicum]